jgi:hypothetical protein
MQKFHAPDIADDVKTNDDQREKDLADLLYNFTVAVVWLDLLV